MLPLIKELHTYSIYVDGIFLKSEVRTDQYPSSDIIHFGNHIPWKNSNVNPGFDGLIDDVSHLRPCLIRRRSAGSVQHGAVVPHEPPHPSLPLRRLPIAGDV